MTLYTLTGLPYSGKTTLLKELLKHFNLKVVSVDEIMNERDMWREGHPTMDDWSESYTLAYDTLIEYLQQGLDVLFDGGSLKFSERETQRKIAKECGAQHKLIYVNTSREEVVRRKLKNEVTKQRVSLTEKEMGEALGTFDEPTEAEHPILYNQTMDLERWIEANFEQ